MRTNIDIDERLLHCVREAYGFSTKKQAVHEGLEMLMKVKRQAKILEFEGKLKWSGDLEQMRRDG